MSKDITESHCDRPLPPHLPHVALSVVLMALLRHPLSRGPEPGVWAQEVVDEISEQISSL